jgi:hypothetical protein
MRGMKCQSRCDRTDRVRTKLHVVHRERMAAAAALLETCIEPPQRGHGCNSELSEGSGCDGRLASPRTAAVVLDTHSGTQLLIKQDDSSRIQTRLPRATCGDADSHAIVGKATIEGGVQFGGESAIIFRSWCTKEDSSTVSSVDVRRRVPGPRASQATTSAFLAGTA